MKILLSSRAEKELRSLPKMDQIAVAKKIRLLTGKTGNDEKLKGIINIFRVRVGNYRIVYKQSSQEIYIVLISHRKDVYTLLRRLF